MKFGIIGSGMIARQHAICEKPLEVTTARIDELIAAATTGKTLAGVLMNQAIYASTRDAGRRVAVA